MQLNNSPLLTIAIPTFNRASFLKPCLFQLFKEIASIDAELIEVIISDNCSTDNTESIVNEYIQQGCKIKYSKNSENIGADANFASCFNLATGKYILLLGDDDFLVDDALKLIVKNLSNSNVGVLCFNAYGFNQDFRKELPCKHGESIKFNDAGEFLATIGDSMTLISSCIINKALIEPLDPHQFCGTNLVHVNLLLHAALKAQSNIYIKQYLVACTRNNSGGYNFWAIFVTNFSQILENFKPFGLSTKAINKIQQHLIISFFPYYLLKARLANNADRTEIYARFEQAYKSKLIKIWIKPTLSLPRIPAIIWGVFTTLIGRILYGDVYKLKNYLIIKIKKF